MRKYLVCLVLGLTLLLGVQPVFSQTTEEYKALRKEIGSLKEGQNAIRKDMQDLKKLIQSRPAAAAAPGGDFKEAIINIKGAPVLGDKNAKLVFVEFTDYQ